MSDIFSPEEQLKKDTRGCVAGLIFIPLFFWGIVAGGKALSKLQDQFIHNPEFKDTPKKMEYKTTYIYHINSNDYPEISGQIMQQAEDMRKSMEIEIRNMEKEVRAMQRQIEQEFQYGF